MQHAIPFHEYPPRDTYLTREEAARALGVSVRCLDSYAKQPGKAPPYMMWRNRAWYKTSDVEAFKARVMDVVKDAYLSDRPYDGPRPEVKPELFVVQVPEGEEGDPFIRLAEEIERVEAAMRVLHDRLMAMGR